MNIRDFEYLTAIDELKNFIKASEKCFVSQPALSQQVKKIENQLGFNIFERNKKSIITTQKGQEVIKYAKAILTSYAKIKSINSSQVSLRIALIPTICPYLLPHIVDELRSQLPDVKFYFLELKTEDLMIKLKAGEIDIGIIAYFKNLLESKLSYTKLYDEEFFLALAKTSALTAKDFPKIMADKKLILLEEGNCISDNIKDICDIYGQNSFNDFYATNIETVKNMVRINNGAALLPKLSCMHEEKLKIAALIPKKSREIGIMSRKNYEDKILINAVETIISKAFHSVSNT